MRITRADQAPVGTHGGSLATGSNRGSGLAADRRAWAPAEQRSHRRPHDRAGFPVAPLGTGHPNASACSRFINTEVSKGVGNDRWKSWGILGGSDSPRGVPSSGRIRRLRSSVRGDHGLPGQIDGWPSSCMTASEFIMYWANARDLGIDRHQMVQSSARESHLRSGPVSRRNQPGRRRTLRTHGEKVCDLHKSGHSALHASRLRRCV